MAPDNSEGCVLYFPSPDSEREDWLLEALSEEWEISRSRLPSLLSGLNYLMGSSEPAPVARQEDDDDKIQPGLHIPIPGPDKGRSSLLQRLKRKGVEGESGHVSEGWILGWSHTPCAPMSSWSSPL